MKLLISLLDIAALTSFSRNIGPALVMPYIREAHTFDMQLPATVRALLEQALPGINPAFQPDDVNAADFATAAAAAGWADAALARFWYEALRPLLVYETARRMLLWHGLHITPNGAETTNDRPISPQERAALRADLMTKVAYYRPLYLAGLRQLASAQGTTSCSTATHRPGRGGFRAVAV